MPILAKTLSSTSRGVRLRSRYALVSSCADISYGSDTPYLLDDFSLRRHCWTDARDGKIDNMKSKPAPNNRANKGHQMERLGAPLRRWVTALVVGIPLVTSSCAEIIPRFELRDNYMFKRFLQPNRVVGEIMRDELGNPVLPKSQQQPVAN
jgi:hypothetical protein